MRTSATKRQVAELAREVFGAGTGVVARRRFDTWWVVEVSNAAGAILLSDSSPSLPKAYGAAAVRLRALRGAA